MLAVVTTDCNRANFSCAMHLAQKRRRATPMHCDTPLVAQFLPRFPRDTVLPLASRSSAPTSSSRGRDEPRKHEEVTFTSLTRADTSSPFVRSLARSLVLR